MQQVNRIHYMDALRTVLMMLGIFNHSSFIYHPNKTWRIDSEQSMEIIGWLSTSSVAFRMSGFFVISGFFCALTLSRYDVGKFLRVRLVRIAVPLIVTACTLNLLQSYFLYSVGLAGFSFKGHFLEGGWISHVWFLRNLLLYFLFAALFVVLFRNQLTPINTSLTKFANKLNVYAMLLLMPLLFSLIVILNGLGFPLYEAYLFRIIDIYKIFYYVPFFLIGVVFYTVPGLLDRFCNMNLWIVMAIGVASIVILQPTLPMKSPIQVLANFYFYVLIQWCCICLLFKLFRKFFNKASDFWTFGSDAAYSVYLFHHILIVIFGYIAVSNNVHPLIAMGVMIPLTLALTLLNHVYVIKKVPLLQYLFNGK